MVPPAPVRERLPGRPIWNGEIRKAALGPTGPETSPPIASGQGGIPSCSTYALLILTSTLNDTRLTAPAGHLGLAVAGIRSEARISRRVSPVALSMLSRAKILNI